MVALVFGIMYWYFLYFLQEQESQRTQSLLTIPAGFKQRDSVNKIIEKVFFKAEWKKRQNIPNLLELCLTVEN